MAGSELRLPAADGYSLAATLPRLGHFGFFREGPTKSALGRNRRLARGRVAS